ncbi:LIM domain only protein 7 isoform X12 [Esox lucius]|uniref:LIM domain only protein 7 isoform X12 n=1 Tax=Esox lucius TaxID=8010 RepID=UPI001476CAB5|nr:LIM domain only protein 7 isoform X12 [Esox lucius]
MDGGSNHESIWEQKFSICTGEWSSVVLINSIKPGIIKRVNRLSTPIAGLDNVNVFLKACRKIGLKEAQLFHPGDLQDTSTRVSVKHQETSRRLKNVLITLYWLGRKAQSDPFYDGPNLNLNTFEGLLGIAALAKALESPSQRASSSSLRERDSGFRESWCCDREEKEDIFPVLREGGGVHRIEDSLDSLDSLGSRPQSRSSDNILKGSSEGCGSDAEADSDFRMAGDSNKDLLHYRRSLVITPKTTTQFNQFLPTKDKPAAYMPAPLRKKRAEHHEDNRRSWASPMFTEEDGTFTSETRPESSNGSASRNSMPPAGMLWVYEYESGSDDESDAERPDPDLVLDDLASRRFHSPSQALPTNFAVPINPLDAGNATRLKGKGGGVSMERGGTWPMVTVTTNTNVPPQQTVTCLSSGPKTQMCSPKHQMSSVRADHHRPLSADSLLQQMYDDSEDEEDEVGYADPVEDDLYARKVGPLPKVPADVSYDRFLPKFWSPEEDAHVQKIKLGSQSRPWYKKIQGFSRKKSSGSSSEESDCDISPWLSSASPPSDPSPYSHPHAPEGPTYTSHLAASQSSHSTQPLHTAPYNLLKKQITNIPYFELPPVVFPPVDPTSGPRLLRCEKHHLLGRENPLEHPDPLDKSLASIFPDLENDDMFARRTHAIHSNTDLVMLKTRVCNANSWSGQLSTSDPQLNIITQLQRPGKGGKTVVTDNEQDDNVLRKVKPPQGSQRLNPRLGAADSYSPMLIPEPWELPSMLQARLLCPPSPLTREEKTEDRDSRGKRGDGDEHPKTDDMLLRKFGVMLTVGVGTVHIQGQGSCPGKLASQKGPSVPISCRESDLKKMVAIREASRLRHKKRMMIERLIKQIYGENKSKSMTDLGVDPAALRQVRYEELQKIRDMVKKTEDQWQDDLTKWKNRRKSVNSDIVKKKEEREQIEQTTASSGIQRSSRSSIGSRLNSLASLDQDVFEDSAPVIRPRTLPARSYTIDSSYTSARQTSPTPSTFSPTKEEDPVPADITMTNRDISTSRDDMSDSATDSDSDTTSDTPSAGKMSSFNPHIPVSSPSVKAPSLDPQYKLEDNSSATPGINRTSNYNPQVPILSPYEKAPTPLPWCTSAARTEETSNVTPAIGQTSNYTPQVPSLTPSEKAPTPTAKAEEMSSTSTTTTQRFLPKVNKARRLWEGKVAEEVTPSISAGSLYKQPPEHNYVAMETKNIPPVVSQVSSSLPRGYVRSDSARLTSVVTPRPFGSQSSRIASLPRAYTMDDSYKRVNGETEVTIKPLAPSRYSQIMTSEDEAPSSSPHSSGGEEEEVEEEAEKERGRDVTPTLAPSPVPSTARSPSPVPQAPKVAFPVSPVPAKDTNQESYADMRISLNQKPNSSQDFGFQTEWNSTGVRVTTIQPGSSAEMCQLQVGDEVLSVSGRRVDEMSFSEWKSSQELALKKGTLTMDIRRRGRKNWDIDLPSLPFKSRKTINLTSMDHHPTLIGSPDITTVNATNTSLDFTSHGSMEPTKEVASQPIIDVASNGLNGGIREETVTLSNKESVEPISLKNLKRRSEFFEQGGSESTISDMPVPPITPTSNRWSWDAEAERRRQEKWQIEQERVLQEKYRRDQEKLEEEWRRAQREAVTDEDSANHAEPRDLQVDNRKNQFSPVSHFFQTSPTREDHEEERRKREEEAQRRKEEEKRMQVEEEHRRRKEEEQEQLRLQEEKRQKLEEEARRRQREEELKWQRRKEAEREERKHQEAEQKRREQEKKQEKKQWMGDSYGYARVKPVLSMADREKSKSTPDLDDMEKPEMTGWHKGSGGMAQRLLEEELRRKADKRAQSLQAASELELERRNILNAMKYREPERVGSSGGLGEASWRKGQQTLSEAELERQQILQEMKKKTQLSTDNSWIRQRSTSTATRKDPTSSPIRRGESLDNLDTVPCSSWHSSWTPGSTSSIPNYSRPHSTVSGLNPTSFDGGYSDNGVRSRPGSATLPSFLSMSFLKGAGGSNQSAWSQHSPSSLCPIPSPGPESESHLSSEQRNRSVSGKKICTFCDTALGKGAAMIIESLGLCYHLTCFKCIDCKSDLGGSEAGAEVRIRNRQLYCNSCYMRFKTGQPISM